MKIIKGCPICEGDVYGTKETGYYCKHCNLLFQSRNINFKYKKNELKRKIALHFSEYEGKINKKNIEFKKQPEQTTTIIPKRIVSSKEELKKDSSEKSIRAVQSLRKIDGYGLDEDKPAIIQFIDEHLKKFKEHQEKIKKKASIKKRKNYSKKSSKKKTNQ